MKAIMSWMCVSAAALMLTGCGGGGGREGLPETVDASGVVTLDGAPVDGASIVFVPDGGEYPAFAMSGDGGAFSLTAFEGVEGAVAGNYMVQVSRTVEVQGAKPSAADLGEDAAHLSEEEKQGVSWKNDLPGKYANPTTSELTVTIPAEGITNITLALESK